MKRELTRKIGTTAHIDHGKTSLTAAITKILAKQEAPPMTNDKALEAALLPCPFCGGKNAYVQNAGWKANTFIRCPDCPSSFATSDGPRPHEDSLAAWNRRAPVSALSGEAEVVGWAYRGPRGGLIVTEEKPKHSPEAEPLVTLASLQAMQARAEAAERERAEAEEAENETKDVFWAIYPSYLEMGGQPISTEVARTDLANRAEAAEACVKELEDALEPFAEAAESYDPVEDGEDHQAAWAHEFTIGSLRRARTALKGGFNG